MHKIKGYRRRSLSPFTLIINKIAKIIKGKFILITILLISGTSILPLISHLATSMYEKEKMQNELLSVKKKYNLLVGDLMQIKTQKFSY